jgi:hypothetical protein
MTSSKSRRVVRDVKSSAVYTRLGLLTTCTTKIVEIISVNKFLA